MSDTLYEELVELAKCERVIHVPYTFQGKPIMITGSTHRLMLPLNVLEML